MRVTDLVTGYIAAIADETHASARVKALRARMDTLVRAEHATSGSDRWRAPDYGDSTVRLDGTTAAPTIAVTAPTVFADWLAQSEPGCVTATITVPAALLEGAITALEFADVPHTAQVQPSPDATTWISQHCIPVPDPTDPEGTRWTVHQVADDDTGETVVVAPDVPGLAVVRRQSRLVVTLDRKIRTRIEQDAMLAVDAEMAAIDATDSPADTGTETDAPDASVDAASAAIARRVKQEAAS
jgi:hypothetical protein